MIRYKALRVVHGDFGTVHPGGTFEVQDFMAKKLEPLEARGVIMRDRPRPSRKMYTVYENKSVAAPENKTAKIAK